MIIIIIIICLVHSSRSQYYKVSESSSTSFSPTPLSLSLSLSPSLSLSLSLPLSPSPSLSPSLSLPLSLSPSLSLSLSLSLPLSLPLSPSLPSLVKKEKLSKDDSLTQSSSSLILQTPTPTLTPTAVSDVSLSLKGTATSVNTPQLSQASPIKVTPTLIKGRADLTTPIIKTATPPSPHKRVGLATPPKLVSPTVSKSPPVDFTDLQNKLKSVPPIIIKGASPIANVGVAKGATPPPLLIKGAFPSVGVSVPSRSVITGAKATPSHTNVITSRGVTPPSKTTPSVDPHHKVVKKSTKVQSVQLPKQTIDALLSVLKNTNSGIYTSDLAQLVTVTTRQQTTPTQRPVTLSPSPSSVRIVQAPPPATPPATVPSVHPLSDHYYVTTPSSVQYVPASTSGVSLITGNFINKTSSNN